MNAISIVTIKTAWASSVIYNANVVAIRKSSLTITKEAAQIRMTKKSTELLIGLNIAALPSVIHSKYIITLWV